MYVYLWEFLVSAEHRCAFESAYGPDGEWVRLFRRDAAYLGTELLRDRRAPGRYLTIDRWRSADACRAFRDLHADEISALDIRCAAWTLAEESLGELDAVGERADE